MKGRLQARASTLVLSAVALFPGIAHAQDPLPPVRSSIDEHGVDLLSGTLIVNVSDISIGPDDARGLAYTRQSVEAGWRPTIQPVLSGSLSNPIVTFNGKSASFTSVSGGYEPDAKDGSIFEHLSGIGYFRYTTRDGTVVDFVQDGYTYLNSAILGQVTQVTFPDGNKHKFFYNRVAFSDPSSPGVTFYHGRLSSITSSAAYQLKMLYEKDSISSIADVFEFHQLNSVVSVNNEVELCDPYAFTCTFINQWPTVQYDYNLFGKLASVIDAKGQTWGYEYTSDGKLTGITRPGSSSPNMVYDYPVTGLTNQVKSVTKNGAVWDYLYDVGVTHVVGPAQPVRGDRAVEYDTIKGLVTSDRNALGDETTYEYCTTATLPCQPDKLRKVVFPETNTMEFEYDARGNVVKTKLGKKANATGTIDISSTFPYVAGYPNGCDNIKTCNKPHTTTNGRGNITSFEYGGSHGQVVSELKPPPGVGDPQPHTTFAYTAKYNAVSGDSVYMRTAVETCRSKATCSGGDVDQTKITTSYHTSTGNLLPTSETVAAGDGSISAATAFTYDAIGNLETVDGPISGSGDTTRRTYDGLRRLTMEIGADPDGSGAKPSRSVKYNYDSKSRLGSVEYGTSDSLGSSFSAAEAIVSEFDAYDRKSRDTLMSGGVATAMKQYSYDNLSSIDCTATRMNASLVSISTHPCSLNTVDDRIVRNIYDLAGRVTQVRTLVGTGGSERAKESYEYQRNGKIKAVVDANNNRTEYEFDAFDRHVKTKFPSKSLGAGSVAVSRPDYEEFTLDNNSNIVMRRLRDGSLVYLHYDDLDRLVLKDTPNLINNDLDITYTYDLQGRLRSASGSPWFTNVFTYDALGRLKVEQKIAGTVSHDYDLSTNRRRMTWSDGFYVDYLSDPTGAVTSIRENGAASGPGVLATYEYDNLGRRSSITRGNGVVTTYSYAGSRLEKLEHDLAGGANDLKLEFTYNKAGQIETRELNNDSYAWAGAQTLNHDYDRNGLNQYTQVSPPGGPPSVTYTYDARGNTQTGGPVSYFYTVENRVAVASQLAGSHYLSYEPGTGELFHLYKPGPSGLMDTLLLTSGGRIIDEIDLLSSQRVGRYVFGPNLDEPIVSYDGVGTRSWLIADERGSIIAKTSGSGAAIATAAYDEYGIPSGGDVGRFGYTGQAFIHEIGVNYYKARMYSPTLGRFLQTDPVGYSDGLNIYNYVSSDPVNLTDPLGLAGKWACVYVGEDESGYCQWHDDGIDRLLHFNVFNVLGQALSDMLNSIEMPDVLGLRNNNPNPACSSPMLTTGGQVSGTLFLASMGGSASAELGVARPILPSTSWVPYAGSQIYLRGSVAGLAGLGFFKGAGVSGVAGYNSGALTTQRGPSVGVQVGLALPAGGEVSVAGDGGSGAVSAGPRAGMGGYVAGAAYYGQTFASQPLGCP